MITPISLDSYKQDDIEERKYVYYGSYTLHSLIKMEKGEGAG